jgi:hypothetical protein
MHAATMTARLAQVRLRRRERRLSRELEERLRAQLDRRVAAAARLVDDLTRS